MASTPPKIRILSFLTKRSDMSYEDFFHHWEYVHAPLVAPWALKHGFENYIQLHTPPALRDLGRSAEGNHPAALPYDGVAIFDPPSLEAFTAAFEDPYYKNVIALDEPKFVRNRKDIPRTMGEPRAIIRDGKLLVESNGEIMEEWRRWENKGKI